MRRRASVVLALAVTAVLVSAAVTPLIAGQADPFTGTWKLNHAKSSLPAPAPQSVVSHIECTPKWVSVREEIVDANGQPQTVTGKAGFDGKDYPIAGSPSVDHVSYQRIDARTIKGTAKKNGQVVMHETVVLSPDGKTFTATYAGPDGKAVGSALFEKQ